MANETEPGLRSDDDREAAKAFELIAAGRVTDGAKLLNKSFGRRLSGYFFRRRVPEAHAEELAADALFTVIEQLCRDPGKQIDHPMAWIWCVARTTLYDWIRRETAEKRGGKDAPAQVDLDDLTDKLVAQAYPCPTTEWAVGVKSCMERAIARFEQAHPACAAVLHMVYEDWTSEEIAVYYGADPNNVTDDDKKRARQRKSYALQTARRFFEDCKEYLNEQLA